MNSGALNTRTLALPEGRTGQALAAAIALLALAVVWLSAVAPLTGWFAGRAVTLVADRAEITHTIGLRRSLPALRAAVATAAAHQTDTNGSLLAGGSDAIAGAALQSALQQLAAQQNTSLDSIAVVPPQPEGSLRRIGVQVSVTATWPVLVALLAAIDNARPRMIVDQLSVISSGQDGGGQDATLQAGFTVSAFRTGAP